MEKIAFQLAWLGEHKVLIFLFFAELLVAACLLIVFFHLRLSWRRLNFNKSNDKGNLGLTSWMTLFFFSALRTLFHSM